MKKIWYAAIGMTLTATLFMVMAFTDNETVATVGNTDISKEALYEEMVSAYGADTLSVMITDEIIRQEAANSDVEVTAEEIEAELTSYAESYGGIESLETVLASSGVTTADLEADIEMYLSIEKLIGSDIEITDEEITAYFEENKEAYGQAATVEASHILVATQEEAEEVKAKLDAGEDFSELAAEYSTDTTTAEIGGELGPFAAGEMTAAFEEAAFSMEAGDISDPVETEYGFHIIQVTGKTEAVEATLEDAKEEIYDVLFETELNTEYTAWLSEKTESYNIVNTLVN